MKKLNIYDVKILLKKVADALDDDHILQANFTIASEYYGELKLFLTRILIVDKISVPYEKELKKLLKQLKRIW